MSIPLISIASIFTNTMQGVAPGKGDHSTIAHAGQVGEQAVKKSKTDTVTISKKAIQMVSTTQQSASGDFLSEKAVSQTRG